MPLRIWCKSFIDGTPSETVLPDTHAVGIAAMQLRRMLTDILAAQPGWSIKGPFHEDGKFARWELVDQRGAIAAAYRLVGPRDWMTSPDAAEQHRSERSQRSESLVLR